MGTWTSSPTLTNITLYGNSAAPVAAACSNTNSYPTLKNVILWGNTLLKSPDLQ